MKVSKRISLSVDGKAGRHERQEVVKRIICAGYAGRDQASVRKHIEELKALGVPAPEQTPAFYLVPAEQITMDDQIVVDTATTSGEVEFVLLKTMDDLLVTVGSDHTDREMEKSDVPRSKAVCPKVVAPTFWRVAEVIDHWDKLRLRSWIRINGRREIYQDAYVAELLDPASLEKHMAAQLYPFAVGDVLFSGTVPSKGGLRISDLFEMELIDEVTGRSIQHSYKVLVKGGSC